MNNMLDEMVETYAKLYYQKKPVGMNTYDNKTKDGLREEEVTIAPG